MKPKANHSTRQSRQTTGCVVLEITQPEAVEAYVAGSFNDWNPSNTPMTRLQGGKWVKELELPAGRYEYRFVVDGQWTDDPAAKETVPNPFGGLNAVVIVEQH